MAKVLNDKDEYFSKWGTDYAVVDRTKSHSNFDIFGTNADQTLVLHSLETSKPRSPKNIDVHFFGGGGDDVLSYTGNNKGVDVTVSEKDGYDFKIAGGYSSKDSDYKLNNLRVWTDDVETFMLTSNTDIVDIAGATFSTTFFLQGGDDRFTGSVHDDVVDGGAGDDRMFAGRGNDTINATVGEDFVSGGLGNDVLIAQVQMGDQNGVTYLYGDWDTNADQTIPYQDLAKVMSQGAGTYNEADVFMVGYSTEYIIPPSSVNNNSNFWGTALDTAVGGAIGATGFGSIGQAAISIGYSAVAPSLKSMIGAGTEAESGLGSSKTHEVIIGDFDAWADVAIVSIDEHAASLQAGIKSNGSNQAAVQLTYSGLNAVQLALAETRLSFMEGETQFPDVYSETISKQIAANLLSNSIKVTTDGSGNVTIKTTSGAPLDLSDADAAELKSHIGASNEGVWIFGDYGNSVLYGNDISLAGTNSDNIMYSGSYSSVNDGTSQVIEDAFSGSDVLMIGGKGDDIIFGSTDSGDKLYGGADNDILVTAGSSDLGKDELYGGNGTDLASFETLYVSEDMADDDVFGGYSTTNTELAVTTYFGVFVDLGAKDAHVLTADQWQSTWEAFANGTNDTFTSDLSTGTNYGNQVATFDSIEGVIGSDQRDFISGSAGNDYIYGGGEVDALAGGEGNDYIVGGKGWDLHFGGGGADTFVFQGHATTGEKIWWERIYDFDVNKDTVLFNNTFDRSYDALSISDHTDWRGVDTGNTLVHYGDGSLYLYGVTAAELTAGHFDFA